MNNDWVIESFVILDVCFPDYFFGSSAPVLAAPYSKSYADKHELLRSLYRDYWDSGEDLPDITQAEFFQIPFENFSESYFEADEPDEDKEYPFVYVKVVVRRRGLDARELKGLVERPRDL